MKTAPETTQLYRRGLGLKKEVEGQLATDFSSTIIQYFKQNDFQMQMGDTTILMAREFGFCYGVDRAVDYAYQSRRRFPDKRIFLTGELIHNPHVNLKMLKMGVEFLTGRYAGDNSYAVVESGDVVILPAFGVTIQVLKMLKETGCILVDTTCGSVLNVWKRVEKYAREGITSIIHGKYQHEETQATSSQTMKYDDAHYLVVLDMQEAEMVCDFIRGDFAEEAFLAHFKEAISPGFSPAKHLQRVGVANQTTMLSTESIAIANKIKAVMEQKYGVEEGPQHFSNFDTICSATQERQDAVIDLFDENELDLMLVIGGFNSSNTTHLAELAGEKTSAYHIDDAACLRSERELLHKPVDQAEPICAENWLKKGPLKVGLTAGASTPNSKIGEVVARFAELQGQDLGPILDLQEAGNDNP